MGHPWLAAARDRHHYRRKQHSVWRRQIVTPVSKLSQHRRIRACGSHCRDYSCRATEAASCFICGRFVFCFPSFTPRLSDPYVVAISDPSPQARSDWHLFNDFLVSPVNQQAALDFSPPWKTPVILIYQVQHARNTIDNSWKQALDLDPLYYNGSMKYVMKKIRPILAR